MNTWPYVLSAAVLVLICIALYAWIAGRGAQLLRETAALAIGSFLGASLAFAFEASERAAHRLDALDDMLCMLASITHTIVEPKSKDRYHWFNMNFYAGPLEARGIDYRALAFLLREHAGVIGQLRDVDRKFSVFTWAVMNRSEVFDRVPTELDLVTPIENKDDTRIEAMGSSTVGGLQFTSRIMRGDQQLSERMQKTREQLRAALALELGEHFGHLPKWNPQACGEPILVPVGAYG